MFMLKMKNSGYSQQYRKQILISALKAFDEMVKADQTGEKPLYRDKKWQQDERKQEHEKRKLNWYKACQNGHNKQTNKNEIVKYNTVLFVPVTKGGILAKELKIREAEINKYSKTRIKIVEDGGVQLKNFLVEKNPFPQLKCEKKCFVCKSESSDAMKYPCNSNNVGYRLECDTCIERGKVRVYEGESSRSARVRGAEHMADFQKKRRGSVLWKHKENEHKDEDMNMKMIITKKFKDPLSRQANEAVRISNRSGKTGELLNSKSEFHHPPVGRIMVEKRNFGKKCLPKQSQTS